MSGFSRFLDKLPPWEEATWRRPPVCVGRGLWGRHALPAQGILAGSLAKLRAQGQTRDTPPQGRSPRWGQVRRRTVWAPIGCPKTGKSQGVGQGRGPASLQPQAAREANGPGLHSGAQALRAPRRGPTTPCWWPRRAARGTPGRKQALGSHPGLQVTGEGPPRGSDHSGRPVSLPHTRGGLPGGWGPRTGRGIARFRPTWSGEAAVWPQVERPAEAGGCRRAPLLLCGAGDVGGAGGDMGGIGGVVSAPSNLLCIRPRDG